MRCYIHGGEDVGPRLLVIHHKHPTGWGGKDVPENKISICASCHDLLHKIAESFFAKKRGVGADLANQYLPNDPRRRQLLLQLANQAATAKRDYYANHPDEVPEIEDNSDTVMVSLEISRGLHHRLKTLSSGYQHENGRKVGLYRYIVEVLKNHAKMKGAGDAQPELAPMAPTTALKTPDEWEIF